MKSAEQLQGDILDVMKRNPACRAFMAGWKQKLLDVTVVNKHPILAEQIMACSRCGTPVRLAHNLPQSTDVTPFQFTPHEGCYGCFCVMTKREAMIAAINAALEVLPNA